MHSLWGKSLSGKGKASVYDTFLRDVETYFEEVRLLKRGARGSVTLLRHRSTGKRYIFRRFTGSAEVYRKLLTVDCPYLPRIEEVAEQDGQVAVLEEYVQGDTLTFLLEGGVLSWPEARRVTEDVCAALWVLHSLGAVHRDVKDSNVILRGDQAVLIDFDASRIIKPEGTADTVVLGTTGYAAPEQFGLSQTDGRADIYSLGVLLNVMLTGQHPSRQLAAGHAGRVVQRCTMTSPEQRYHSVQELREAL
ncbi:MAG TPA: serine/threonine protein kinase [Oscillibacter sp.]|nr:serine/threonine protein kinase [Oscillibacter sp.]